MLKVYFYIRYGTLFGESLWLTGNIPQLGGGDPEKAIAMDYLNKEYWTYALELNTDDTSLPEDIHYAYFFKDLSGRIVEEWNDNKVIALKKINTPEVYLVDTWNFAGQYENVFYTRPFQRVLLPSAPSSGKPVSYQHQTHIFKVKAPLLQKGEAVCLLGSADEMGRWDPASPVWMSREDNWWVAAMDVSHGDLPVAYKYAVYHTETKSFIRYEGGSNRLLHVYRDKKRLTICHDGFVRLDTTWRGAGVNIPVFSLRSAKGMGVGEFGDLRLLIDWAKKTGLRMIQLLPVNDTTANQTWEDSYPYNAISAFALHPLYLNIEEIAGHEGKPLLKSLADKKNRLNELTSLDYEEVMRLKWFVIKQIYQVHKRKFFKRKAVTRFMKDNRHWLTPYAAYCYLRDKNGTTDFRKWGEYAVYDPQKIEELSDKTHPHFDEIGIRYFVQFHLHAQLKNAREYAHKHGIILKGDIPIGVHPHGCDVWMEPEFFHTDMQAGAPPDDFAVKGQNWGFPTYNWERMREDGYAWWKRRFHHLGHYFDAFRIDHILGFFRIWSVPQESVEGIMGHFVPAIPLTESELKDEGIHVDIQRLCKPYITESVLRELPDGARDSVMDFLDKNPEGNYSLKPEFATQQKVRDYFSAGETNQDEGAVQSALYDLISNVILLEDPHRAGQFHFRIDMEKISSYRFLDDDTRQNLSRLYNQYFFQNQDVLWETEAMLKLPALKKSTDMLVCGEDLGMVPRCVPLVMKRLGILSLEIQRMPKQSGLLFFNPANAPKLSVVMPSTHDTSTLRGWWEEDREKTQQFFNGEMHHPGLAPYYCEPWVNKAIIIQHLYSPALWSVFLLQDLMGMDGKIRREYPADERINVPAVPKFYWRYRMHLTLEQLLQEDDFNHELRSYVQSSGRAG